MSSSTVTRQQLIEVVNQLPADKLPELANFLAYLNLKNEVSEATATPQSGSEFLLSIAAIGESDETDISEHDEEILAAEIDPIRGWSVEDSR